MFRKTARLALAIRFVTNFDFLVPIWFFYGTEVLGLKSSTTVILYMLFPLSIAAFEIPTGALADRLGPKKVSIIGLFLASAFSASYLLFLSQPFMIIIGTLLGGFGYSLFSGTLSTLVHASFKKDELLQPLYNRYLASDRVVAFSARVLGGISAGYLYSLWKSGPYIGVLISNLLGMLLFLFIRETTSRQSQLSQTKHIIATWKHTISKDLLQFLLLSYIGIQLVAESLWTAYQPFYEADGLSSTAIGAIFSVIAFFSAFSAYASGKLLNRFGVLQIMTYRSLLLVTATLFLLQPFTWLRIVALLPAALAFGISSTPLTAAVQYKVPATYHTTAVSIVSLLTMSTYALASIHLGLLIEIFGIPMSRKIVFAESIISAVALFTLYVKQKTHDLILSK